MAQEHEAAQAAAKADGLQLIEEKKTSVGRRKDEELLAAQNRLKAQHESEIEALKSTLGESQSEFQKQAHQDHQNKLQKVGKQLTALKAQISELKASQAKSADAKA